MKRHRVCQKPTDVRNVITSTDFILKVVQYCEYNRKCSLTPLATDELQGQWSVQNRKERETLSVVLLKIQLFKDVTPWRLVTCRRFGWAVLLMDALRSSTVCVTVYQSTRRQPTNQPTNQPTKVANFTEVDVPWSVWPFLRVTAVLATLTDRHGVPSQKTW